MTVAIVLCVLSAAAVVTLGACLRVAKMTDEMEENYWRERDRWS